MRQSSVMRPRFVDWLFTIPFLIAFGAILLVFDPLQRLAYLFGQRPQEIVAGVLQVTLVWAFRISGAHFAVERSPLILPNKSYIFIANHQSLFDIPILGSLFFSNYPKYVSKKELAKWLPSISYNLKRGGSAIIDRSDREQATRVIRELGERIQERNVSAVIFPEGTRAREGKLGRFKSAGALSLLEAAPDVEVVPIAIDGSWQLLRFNLFPIPFGTRIRISVGAPIAQGEGDDRGALLREVREWIDKTLAGWRASSSEKASS